MRDILFFYEFRSPELNLSIYKTYLIIARCLIPVFFITFYTSKMYFGLPISYLILERNHESSTIRIPISRNFSINMLRYKAPRTMITTGLSSHRNFFFTSKTYKWFVYFFHRVLNHEISTYILHLFWSSNIFYMLSIKKIWQNAIFYIKFIYLLLFNF